MNAIIRKRRYHTPVRLLITDREINQMNLAQEFLKEISKRIKLEEY